MRSIVSADDGKAQQHFEADKKEEETVSVLCFVISSHV
jgi:hypothetical protein